jgi:hypothetical protein
VEVREVTTTTITIEPPSQLVEFAALCRDSREDGIFPLLSNDRRLSATEVLRAYKRQPLLEKRFSQFKTDFAVAPV